MPKKSKYAGAGRYGLPRIEWDSFNGKAYEVDMHLEPCPGYAGRPHFETWEDEYGSDHYCPNCRGQKNGQVYVRTRVRKPKYDAPQPKGQFS